MTPDHSDTATRVLLATLRQSRPTVRSVAFEVGRSVSHTHAALVELRDAGLVTWDRGRRGTLRPTCGFAPSSARLFGPNLLVSEHVIETAPSCAGNANPGPCRPLGGRL